VVPAIGNYERLKALSAAGDPLERLAQVIDFDVFRKDQGR
jgi:hypothetical protein